ncbi:MAG: ABC transporter ATP-binding protein, partial [Candidatus Avelusimicrobium sp.]
GTCQTFTGDLEDYKARLLKNNDRNDLASDKMTSKEAQRKAAAERRARVAPLKKEIRALDDKIEKLSARKAALEEQLVAQYTADASIELALLNGQLKDAEEEWLRLNEECEAALAEE